MNIPRFPIHFIGAGPGAEDLITERGAALLKEADVVVYAGSLVNPGHLKRCRPEAELHDSARMNLEEQVEVMARGVLEGKKVVRLHTGDPSMYGAVAEQFDLLDKKGIESIVVPGVSSQSAATSPAAASASTKVLLLCRRRISPQAARPEGRSAPWNPVP